MRAPAPSSSSSSRAGALVATLITVAALASLAPAAARAAAPELELPISPASLEAYAAAHPSATLEDFLADLPRTIVDSFVLLGATESLQLAEPVSPRVIHFGSDARFLLATSGVPKDPRYDVAEFAAFDDATGVYRFGTVTFTPTAPPLVETDVALCEACHGKPTRPIWGQYPTWPGAYSDNEGRVAVTSRGDFRTFVGSAKSRPHYKHLRFESAADGSTFLLSSRKYPYANTDLNHEIGNTVALGTRTRMRAAPDYDKWLWAVLATTPSLSCIDTDVWSDITRRVDAAYQAGPAASYPPTTRRDVKAMRLLGVDAPSDLSLEGKVARAASGSAGAWQTGAYRLDEALAFAVLQDAMDRDLSFRAVFSAQRASIDAIAARTLLVGEARAAALKTSYAWFLFFDVFDPVVSDRRRHEDACGKILAHLL
jgi:hypothetical protein